MESDGISLVIVLCMLIVMSAYFSATETAFTSFNKIRMKNLANSGNKKAELVIRLDEDYDKLLSTILIGNNVVNIMSASLATILFVKMLGNQEQGVTVSTVVMTIVVLIFGEVSPKSIAKKSPESFALFSAPILRLFVLILTPLNLFFALWKKLLDKLFKIEGQPSITEEELKTMIDEVENEGVINKHESELIRSAIEFNDVDVEDIFTPRTNIVGINENATMEEIKETFLLNGYSRLPVFRNNIDHIVGVVHERDFYQGLNRGEAEIKKLLAGVLYVTPNKKISELLRSLQQSKAHMAIVIDEYGGTEGLVTMEDIIEELVGEIWDEHDVVIEHFKKIGDNRYIISCNADIDDMFDLFGMKPEKELEVSTVNGWLMKIFEEIPSVDSKIMYEDLDITVTKAEAKRVLEICVQRLNHEDNNGESA